MTSRRAIVAAGIQIASSAPGTAAAHTASAHDLMTLVNTLMLARRCYRIIMVNFVGTIAIDGVGVVLAAVGLLNPLLAAFIHVSSELAFILNSARLLRYPRSLSRRM